MPSIEYSDNPEEMRQNIARTEKLHRQMKAEVRRRNEQGKVSDPYSRSLKRKKLRLKDDIEEAKLYLATIESEDELMVSRKDDISNVHEFPPSGVDEEDEDLALRKTG